MQKLKVILLLFIIGITLIPWQLVCTTHPLGHKHHQHDGPSLCELHRISAQQGGKHILPPMDCKHISDTVDTYNENQTEKIVPSIQFVAMAVVLFDLLKINYDEQPTLLAPEPNCRSATLLSDSPLRAPPLV